MKDTEPRTVLMVEDNPDDQLLIRRAFKKAGLAQPLQAVDNGDDAVLYLAGEDDYADRSRFPMPSLILLDIKLPRRSGLEVLAWLRGQEKLRRTPVVMLTSSSDMGDIDRAYDLGANSYLVKPVEFDDLLQMTKTLGLYWLVLNEAPTG